MLCYSIEMITATGNSGTGSASLVSASSAYIAGKFRDKSTCFVWEVEPFRGGMLSNILPLLLGDLPFFQKIILFPLKLSTLALFFQQTFLHRLDILI